MRQEEYLPITYQLFIIIILLLMGGCASLPPNSSNLQSFALQDTEETPLGKAYNELHQNSSGESGFILLANALDALAIGPVVNEVSTSFNTYWNSDVAYPLETLHPELLGSDKLEEGIEHIYWRGLENDQERVWTKDPHTGFCQRLGIFFMSPLPIESQL